MSHGEQDRLAERIRARLDEGLDSLEPDVLRRLNESRYRAIHQQTVSSAAESAGTGESVSIPGSQHAAGNGDERLVAAIKASLNGSTKSLSPEVNTRLDWARANAVSGNRSSMEPDREQYGNRWWQLIGFFRGSRLAVLTSTIAGLCVLAMAVLLVDLGPDRQSGPELVDVEVLLFSSNEDIDLADNLEFYLWLADNGLPN